MRALADYEMTPEQWQVMQALWSTEEDLTQNDVAHLTLKDKHTVSRILKRLERDGWIVKRPHPEDARAHVVEPTKRAWTLRGEVPRKLNAHFDGILEVLDRGEAAPEAPPAPARRTLNGSTATVPTPPADHPPN